MTLKRLFSALLMTSFVSGNAFAAAAQIGDDGFLRQHRDANGWTPAEATSSLLAACSPPANLVGIDNLRFRFVKSGDFETVFASGDCVIKLGN